MFYNYLKSIYNILDKYDSKSSNFNDMLNMNEYLIRAFNNPYIGNNSYINTNTNTNNVFFQLGGTNHIEDLKLLKSSILDIIANFKQPTNQIDEELTNKVKKFKDAMENLIKYINLLYALIPNQENVDKLNTQLKQIKDILDKY
jgi:hypothetical protein